MVSSRDGDPLARDLMGWVTVDDTYAWTGASLDAVTSQELVCDLLWRRTKRGNQFALERGVVRFPGPDSVMSWCVHRITPM